MRYDLEQILNDENLRDDLEVQKDALFMSEPNLINIIKSWIKPFNSSMLSVYFLLYFYLMNVDENNVTLSDLTYTNYENLLTFWYDTRTRRDLNNDIAASLWQPVTPHKTLYDIFSGAAGTLAGFLLIGLIAWAAKK